jgi:16S rRNA (uracil1498-N3)-methyltransferase
LTRWERIVTEAARQCGRGTIPAVRWFPTAAAAAAAADHDLRLLLNEDERTTRLNETLADAAPHGSIAVAIGPEGGFDPLEIGHFGDNGFRSISLGRRILRTETAAIAIVAVLQYIHGDI